MTYSGEGVPPHDLEAERAVIGAMLVSEPALSIIAEKLKREDFYSETHRAIFDAAMALYLRDEPVDRLTISGELTGGWAPHKEYVYKLLESVPTAANANRYADMVRDRAILRSLIDTSDRIREDAYRSEQDSQGVIERSEHRLYEISSGNESSGGSLEPTSSLATELLDDVQQLYEAGGQIAGLESGFGDLDRKVGGFADGDLVLVAARPSMGKTALGLQVAMNVAREGKGVAFFSLEMSRKQLGQRLLSLRSGVSLTQIRSGDIPQDMWTQVVRATAEIGRMPLHIDDTAAISVPSMRSRLRRLHARLKDASLGLVVVDYVGLCSSSANARSREQEIAEISRSLKVLARDFNVPVLALAQLNRSCETRNDKRPMLSDLRDSGSQEQDADIVMFLYRDEYYNPDSDSKGLAEVIVAKHRNGPTGKVELAWIGRQARFASLSRTSDGVVGRAS